MKDEHVPADKFPARRELLQVLATMPEEAFGYFVAWATGGVPIQYPSGLGGFMPDSQASIKQLRADAAAYLKATAK